MKKINILFALVLAAFMAQAQSKEAQLHVQTKALIDTTVMMVDAESSKENYTSSHWNDKVFSLKKASIEPLNAGSEGEGFSALHWNNKVIRLNKLAASDTSNYFSDHLKYLSVH